MKKELSLLLAISVFTGLLASCGSDSPNVTDTEVTDAQTTVEENKSNLPEKNFGGEVFTLLSQTQSTVAWSTTIFTSEEQNGDVINDEIFKRNSLCMDKYGFGIEVVEGGGADETRQTVVQSILADDPTYNAVLCGYQQQAATASEGLYADVFGVPYLEPDRDIWDEAILNDLAIGGVSYLLTGDLILTDNDCVYTMIYNKSLADDLKVDGQKFYESVRDGKWTWDMLESYCKDVTTDLNGDSTLDYNDRWAILANLNDGSGDCNNAFIIASDTRYFETTGDSLKFLPDAEKFLDITDRISRFLSPESGYAISYSGGTYPGLTARQAIVTWFNNKQALFLAQVMSAGAQYMRDCDVDFGYLPMPKADENQASYLSHVDSRCPVLSIPIVNKNVELAGFALEALCENSDALVKSYYETCFSSKYTRDEESYEMLLLATENRRYDMGIAFNFGGVRTSVNEAIKQGGQIASVIESIRPVVEESVKNFLDVVKGNSAS